MKNLKKDLLAVNKQLDALSKKITRRRRKSWETQNNQNETDEKSCGQN